MVSILTSMVGFTICVNVAVRMTIGRGVRVGGRGVGGVGVPVVIVRVLIGDFVSMILTCVSISELLGGAEFCGKLHAIRLNPKKKDKEIINPRIITTGTNRYHRSRCRLKR